MEKGTKMLLLAGVLIAGYLYYKKQQEDAISENEEEQDEDDVITTVDENPDEEIIPELPPTPQPPPPPPPAPTCLPAMDSQGTGVGKWISVDGAQTPPNVKVDRRTIITNSGLKVGDTITLDGKPLTIDKFWTDSAGLKGAIKVVNHGIEVGSHAYQAGSQICW